MLVQAGSSEDGKDFAARYAEAVFTAQQTLEEGIAFHKDVKQRAEAIGRNPDGIKILPGIEPVIGDTEAEALALDAGLEPARRQYLTARHLIGRLGGGRGHRTFAGTAEQVADTIEHWYDSGAADGSDIMPAVLPSGPEAFVDRVVPILQERGLFRTQYTARTLRGHYGLPRPANRLFESVDSGEGHFGIALAEAR